MLSYGQQRQREQTLPDRDRTIVEALSVLTDSAGAAAFPGVNYNGGSIAGIPIIPCDEMTAGEILLVDATQCRRRD